MSSVQNNGRGTGGVTGRGFMPGRSGNPGGRSQGLARATRELVGGDGQAMAQLWWSIVQDKMQRTSDRLEASKLLADRGWGKAASYEPLEGDPLDLAALEGAAEQFRASVLRLRAHSGIRYRAPLLSNARWPLGGPEALLPTTCQERKSPLQGFR
jgi:hypothetical protein